MNLLEEIQAAAIDSTVPLPDLLRKCTVLAARLGNKEFREWVAFELNGYPEADAVPSYRILKVQSKGHFAGPMGSELRSALIPPSTIPETYRDRVVEAPIVQSVAALTTMLDEGSRSESDFQIPWPADLVPHVGQRIYRNMNCLQAWQVISRGELAAIVDTVRNRILSFVLEIERDAPDAGSWPSTSPPVSNERVLQVFNTNIAGDVGTVVAGSKDVSIQSIQVGAGNLNSLQDAMRLIGVAEEDVEALGRAVEEDAGAEAKSVGPRITAWLHDMFEKAAMGTLGVAGSTAIAYMTH